MAEFLIERSHEAEDETIDEATRQQLIVRDRERLKQMTLSLIHISSPLSKQPKVHARGETFCARSTSRMSASGSRFASVP